MVLFQSKEYLERNVTFFICFERNMYPLFLLCSGTLVLRNTTLGSNLCVHSMGGFPMIQYFVGGCLSTA
jgi:hypothetical protein